jgi:hypothetical protein
MANSNGLNGNGSNGYSHFSKYMDAEMDRCNGLKALLQALWVGYKNITPWRIDSKKYVEGFNSISDQVTVITKHQMIPDDGSSANRAYMELSKSRMAYFNDTAGYLGRAKSIIESNLVDQQLFSEEFFLGMVRPAFVGLYDLIDAISIAKETNEQNDPLSDANRKRIDDVIENTIKNGVFEEIGLSQGTFRVLDWYSRAAEPYNGHRGTVAKLADASFDRRLSENVIRDYARKEGSGHLERLHHIHMLILELDALRKEDEEKSKKLEYTS